MPKYLADENIPRQVVKRLQEAGYDIKTVSEVALTGIRNFELAELSVRLGRVLLSRDADFTRSKRSLMRRVKVIYVQLDGEPDFVANVVLKHINHGAKLLQRQNVVLLDQEGCHKD